MDYSIKLGIDLDTSDLQGQINKAGTEAKPIPIKLEIENLKEIKKQIQSLGDTKTNKSLLTFNTESLEASLKDVSTAIKDIKASIGTLDSKSGMKSLLSSINQIATALGKVENESDNLVKSLSALSKKDFSINFDVNFGDANKPLNPTAYGRKARKQIIPELDSQIEYLEKSLKQSLLDEAEAAQNAANNAIKKFKYPNGKNKTISLSAQDLLGLEISKDADWNKAFADLDDSSYINKMEAREKHIEKLIGLANNKGVNLDGFYSQFSKGAAELIDDVAGLENAADKAEDINKKIKNLFGGSLDVEGLSGQLQPIIADLGEIKTALQSLSSNNSIDGLTQSFNRLYETLEKLTTNLTLAKSTLDTGFSNAAPVNNATKTAQQTGQKIGEVIGKSATQSAKQSINLDDMLDKQTLDLMDRYSIVGDKGSKAFNEIRQALVECRNELNILKNSDIGIDEEVFDTSRAIDKVTDAIANQMRAVNNLGDEYIELANYMTRFNDPSKGNKVRLPDVIKQEQGDDYRSTRGSLGIAFNTERGISFVDFINDLNHELGDTISLTNGEAAAMDELLRKVELGRQQRNEAGKSEKYRTSNASTEEILEQNGINKEEIYGDVMSIVDVVDSAEQQIAQSSTSAANTVVQNEERRQQAYRETSGVIENLKSTLETMRVDRSSIDAIIKDMEELGFTATDTSVKMKNGGFDITVNGIDNIGRAITEIRHLDSATDEISLVDRKISQSLVETDKFVKQQKQSVSNLTNQINQLNRAANDQNASRPIKDSAHLDVLSSKYDEVISAIQRMKNASSDTFVDEQNNVKRLISEYKSLVSEFKNAENVSTKMKGTDFASGLDIAKNDLEKFKAEAKDFPQITRTIEDLDRAIEGVGDASSLNKFNDQLRVARSELAKIKSETSAVNRSEKVGINVSGLESKIADLQRISPEIDKFETEIDGAKVSVQSLLNDLKQVKTQGDFSVVNARFKAFADAAKSAGIAVTEVAQKAKSVRDIKIKLDDTGFNGFEQEVQRAHAEAEKLESSTIELESALKRLDSAMEGVYSADQSGDVKRLIAANEEYEIALRQVYSQLKLNQQAEKDAIAAQRLNDDRVGFQQKIDTWLTKNSAAAQKFGAEMRNLQLQAQSCDRETLRHLEKEFKRLDSAAEQAGLKMQSLSDRIKTKFKEYSAYFSVAEVFMYVTQGLKDMFDQVVAIDTAMTELKKVTNETDSSYNQFLSNAASRAKELGITIDGLVASAADFARLGFEFGDVQGLAEVANIYSVVGDDIDSVETATQSLISTMTAFKDEMNGLSDSDFALNIVDKFNEVSNNFAISSGGIGEALQRSASSMAAANNSLDETIALITAANTVVQDADSVGTAFKTISMRIKIHCPR